VFADALPFLAIAPLQLSVPRHQNATQRHSILLFGEDDEGPEWWNESMTFCHMDSTLAGNLWMKSCTSGMCV
jgi:hypothetical protein